MRERLAIKTQTQHITKEIQVLTHLFEYFFKDKNDQSGRLEKEVNYLGEVVKKVSAMNEAFNKEIENGLTTSTTPHESMLDWVVKSSWEQMELAQGIHCLIERKEKKDGKALDRQAREEYLVEVIGLVSSEVASGLK